MTYAPAKFEVAMSIAIAVKVTRNVAQCLLYTMIYASAKFEVATPNGLGGDAFLFDLGFEVTRNVAQYPLHHVTYLPAKFEVANSNGLGGDAFTRKYNI